MAVSRECVAFAVLGASALVLGMMAAPVARPLGAVLVGLLNRAADEAPAADAAALLAQVARGCVIGAGPFIAAVLLAGSAAVLAQTRFLVTGAPLQPKLSRLNPWAGLKRLFGMEGLAEAVKAIAKLGAMGWALWLALKAEWASVVASLSWPMAAPDSSRSRCDPSRRSTGHGMPWWCSRASRR